MQRGVAVMVYAMLHGHIRASGDHRASNVENRCLAKPSCRDNNLMVRWVVSLEDLGDGVFGARQRDSLEHLAYALILLDQLHDGLAIDRHDLDR